MKVKNNDGKLVIENNQLNKELMLSKLVNNWDLLSISKPVNN